MRSEMKMSRVVNPVTCKCNLISGHIIGQNAVAASVRKILHGWAVFRVRGAYSLKVILVETAIFCILVRGIYCTASGTSTSPKPCLPNFCFHHGEVRVSLEFSERS